MDTKTNDSKVDFSKGKKYKALINIGFGATRPDVKAGETFHLDDSELAKRLLDERSITEDMNFVETVNSVGGTDSGTPVGSLPAGQVKTAAELRGDRADELKQKSEGTGVDSEKNKADDGDDDDDKDKGKGKGAAGGKAK